MSSDVGCAIYCWRGDGMINGIWLMLLAGGIVCGAINGNGAMITQSAVSGAETAVGLSFKLIGMMCLWLGMMRIAEKAGLLQILARMLHPIMRRLFPTVPSDHPAMGAMVMTISANMLGMGNAATPFGMKAMKELQSLNHGDKTQITSAMCTFLALCAAGVNIIPTTIVALRSAAESQMPGQVIATTILVSCVTACCVIAIDRICRRSSACGVR